MALLLQEGSVPKESSVSSEEVDILAGAKKKSRSEKEMVLVKGAKKIKKIKLSFHDKSGGKYVN